MYPEVQILRLFPERDRDLPLPSYATSGAAGLDLVASEDVLLSPGAHAAIPTGIALAIPVGYEGQVRPRSGLALRHRVTVLNSPGTIDWDYRAEIKVLLINLGDAPYTVRRGDRIAQLVIAPVCRVSLREVSSLPATERGEGGFGSTGR